MMIVVTKDTCLTRYVGYINGNNRERPKLIARNILPLAPQFLKVMIAREIEIPYTNQLIFS